MLNNTKTRTSYLSDAVVVEVFGSLTYHCNLLRQQCSLTYHCILLRRKGFYTNHCLVKMAQTMCKNKILFLYVAGLELMSLTLTAEHATNCAKMQLL